MKPTHRHLKNLANEAKKNVNAFQSLSALGYWNESQPIDQQRLKEVLGKVQSDIFRLQICKNALEQLTA